MIADLLDRAVKSIWFLDSDASKHMTFHREWLYDFHETTNEIVSLGDSTLCEVKGYGSITIKMLVHGGKMESSKMYFMYQLYAKIYFQPVRVRTKDIQSSFVKNLSK